eukprot:4172166-Heterocapsa_arctica.AAC.1
MANKQFALTRRVIGGAATWIKCELVDIAVAPAYVSQRQEKVETIVGDSGPVVDLAEHLERVINPEAAK